MPIYEYLCKKGHIDEFIESLDQQPRTNCNICGDKMQRIIHGSSLLFKGSGFYSTDINRSPAGVRTQVPKVA